MKTLTQLAHECGYKISYCGRFDFACTIFCKKIKSLSVLSYDLFAYIARIYISKFILGNTSGIALVGSIFGTPCALANMTPISASGFNSKDISILVQLI